MQTIGERCFSGSGIEEITLPSTLRGMSENALAGCDSLKTVWVEKGCKIKAKKYVGKNVEVRKKKEISKEEILERMFSVADS